MPNITNANTDSASSIGSEHLCKEDAADFLYSGPGPCWCYRVFVLPLQTVLNTMCGYGMQQLEESPANENIFTIGCLENIIWWAKNNLLLVAGLTGGLLLLEVTPVQLLISTKPLKSSDRCS